MRASVPAELSRSNLRRSATNDCMSLVGSYEEKLSGQGGGSPPPCMVRFHRSTAPGLTRPICDDIVLVNRWHRASVKRFGLVPVAHQRPALPTPPPSMVREWTASRSTRVDASCNPFAPRVRRAGRAPPWPCISGPWTGLRLPSDHPSAMDDATTRSTRFPPITSLAGAAVHRVVLCPRPPPVTTNTVLSTGRVPSTLAPRPLVVLASFPSRGGFYVPPTPVRCPDRPLCQRLPVQASVAIVAAIVARTHAVC